MKVVVEYLVLEYFKSGMVVVYVAVAVKKCVLKCVLLFYKHVLPLEPLF